MHILNQEQRLVSRVVGTYLPLLINSPVGGMVWSAYVQWNSSPGHKNNGSAGRVGIACYNM